MPDNEQESLPPLVSHESLLLTHALRISSEAFKDNQERVDWQLISAELEKMKTLLRDTTTLSLEEKQDWWFTVKFWERNVKAGPHFRADPQGKSMLLELGRLEVKIFMATERGTGLSEVWEEVKRVRSFLRHTRFVASQLKVIGSRHCDELVKKLKAIQARRDKDTEAISEILSARILATINATTAAFTEDLMRYVPKMVPTPKSLAPLLDSSAEPRSYSEVYQRFKLSQTRIRRQLEAWSKELRLHWVGLTGCKPLLLQEGKSETFKLMLKCQNEFHGAWDLWLAGWKQLRAARLKSLTAFGGTTVERLELRLDYLAAQLAYSQAYILELESKYEWSGNDDFRAPLAKQLKREQNTVNRLRKEIREARDDSKKLSGS